MVTGDTRRGSFLHDYCAIRPLGKGPQGQLL
jgi:hypothetical protein